MQIAQVLYAGAPRTPQGFHSEPPPAGYGQVATTHLKNADIDAAAVAPQPLYELCTDDWNQALAWSETFAQQGTQYADLVETGDEPRYFEFGRVRQSEPSVYRRSRVFKCAYLDRGSANLRGSSGAAGQLNRRPLSATELGSLAEYLWQFTLYNNFGHAVLRSSGASSSSQLTHTLHLASLARGGVSSTCDRIDVIAWRHTLDAASGALRLDTEVLWSFGAREAAGVASLCSG